MYLLDAELNFNTCQFPVLVLRLSVTLNDPVSSIGGSSSIIEKSFNFVLKRPLTKGH